MIMRKATTIWILMGAIITLSCREDDSPKPGQLQLNFDFEQNMEDWLGGFADLPSEGQDIYELEINHSPLPEETETQGGAIKVQGHNRSDDLFMFLKKHIHGLEPNTRYQIIYEVELASQYPETSVGIGGSPGGSVFLKVGASTTEPTVVLDESNQFLQMNIDKGNQSQEGADMINIGTIGIEGEEFKYQLIQRNNEDRPFEVTTDSDGGFWAILGTDSGFEGLTVLYYNSIQINIKKKV
jgi:hypothetical protein